METGLKSGNMETDLRPGPGVTIVPSTQANPGVEFRDGITFQEVVAFSILQNTYCILGGLCDELWDGWGKVGDQSICSGQGFLTKGP